MNVLIFVQKNLQKPSYEDVFDICVSRSVDIRDSFVKISKIKSQNTAFDKYQPENDLKLNVA